MAFEEDGNVSDIYNGSENYYRSTLGAAARQHVRNLDEYGTLTDTLELVHNYGTKNFVLDFSDASSYVTFDLSTETFEALLNSSRPESLNARWINVWFPQHQESLIEAVARRYDFSPRLLALMTSDPRQPKRSSDESTLNELPNENVWPCRLDADEAEIEKGSNKCSEMSTTSIEDSIGGGNLYKIIDDMWHYASIDFGRNYVCLGFNSLYVDKSASKDSRLPQTTRLWTWLIFCEDSTVISITEDPFPFSCGRLNQLQQHILDTTRRNLITVFRSLSKIDDDSLMSRRPLSVLPIRKRLGDTKAETAHRLADTPGLLFYYLFENWQNSYTLIARREGSYGRELRIIRGEMFKEPKLCHIDRLDAIGNELGVLKHHFESYARLIERLLEPKEHTNASLQNYRVLSHSSQASLETVRHISDGPDSTLGVSLSSPARARFERLKDLIDVYALTEVDEFLKQKDSLVSMNFQLITIKESLDVEKLTRITLLLTKITMIFLPINLITAYFAVPLERISYTLEEFWITFLIVMLLSASALFVFGVFSGTVQMIPFFNVLCKSTKMANLFHRKGRKMECHGDMCD